MSTAPLRHLSIRVPWHDRAWDGTVCACPGRNTACLKLKNIAESKDEAREEAVAGQSMRDLDPADLPPCVKERGTFMAPFAITREHAHPYTQYGSEAHAHFRPTTITYPTYATGAVPFRWMNTSSLVGGKEDPGLIARFPLEAIDLRLEPGKDVLGFTTNWLQDHRNQRTALDCFWSHLRPAESLVFLYAKQTPLADDTGRRVIIGVGKVRTIGRLNEYAYDGEPEDRLRSLIWERMIEHSIRPEGGDGFLMPYHDVLRLAGEQPDFDPAETVAFAPEDRFVEFSYGAEHVSHDAAISALLACRAALERTKGLVPLSVDAQEAWIDRELGRLWKRRGAFPGLGAILSATGMPLGHHLAQALVDAVSEDGDPWPAWFAAMADPGKLLPGDLGSRIDATMARSWIRMPPERRDFLRLISRIDLGPEQADLIALPENRRAAGISLNDAAFIGNPYLLYESTRLGDHPIEVGTVDRGILPPQQIRLRFPLPGEAPVSSPLDARRLRALAIRELEQAAALGDTLRPRDGIVTTLRGGSGDPNEEPCQVTGDLLAVAEADTFAGEIVCQALADDRPAYQLRRLAATGELIRSTVLKRLAGRRHTSAHDWRAQLDRFLADKPLPIDVEDQALEDRARHEKAAALRELAASRLSVLIGPAGTGKTTLLAVLCQQPEVHKGGILLLAPTGKARVRLTSEVAARLGIDGVQAQTLAQFLSASGRYDDRTQRYRLIGKPGTACGRTIIVDECSMLTEEMLAALLEAVASVDRLILVGDHRQLPPIGAGRPFVDIIRRLTPSGIDAVFPRVGPGFAELTVPRRQGGGSREDLQLAAWFGGAAIAPGEDRVFEILAGRRGSDHVSCVRWDSPAQLDEQLRKALADHLAFPADLNESQAFARSLGAKLGDNGYAWFNNTYRDRPGAGASAEAWQVLSPVRQQAWGVEALNRLMHQRYLTSTLEQARQHQGRRIIPKPMGEQQIVYGDKVINNRNWSVPQYRLYPRPEERGYLANGEIGIVVGHHWTRQRNWKPDHIEVEFATQAGHVVRFSGGDFDEDGQADLELAYALTIHKAQGSEFGTVFLILPRSPRMLSRELLYTALTRQQRRIIILHQGPATDLLRLSGEEHSAIATRLSNLFGPPSLKQVKGRFLEESLIHVTSRGDAVRSKSEVIIANLLHSKGIDYRYEEPLEIDGMVKLPDFTWEDDDAGTTVYWEHLGMLHDPHYRRRWEEKLAWYRGHGILPRAEGQGRRGVLIVSEDGPDGGIDCAAIGRLL